MFKKVKAEEGTMKLKEAETLDDKSEERDVKEMDSEGGIKEVKTCK